MLRLKRPMYTITFPGKVILMRVRPVFSCAALCRLGALAFCVFTAIPQLPSEEGPRLVEKDGRHALLVDGRPYLILGGQIHNSSGWPSELPQVWKSMADLHANTVEAPVYWEQFDFFGWRDAKADQRAYIVVPWIPHKGLFTAAMASKAASDFNAWGKVIRAVHKVLNPKPAPACRVRRFKFRPVFPPAPGHLLPVIHARAFQL